ncbi:hypothetical protein K2173_017091 [Erythroxylum novogranatense]|uniref:Uncharacterized protein n=1 Tax=Erythroxylum novogranatense TaxID=1862640 RepID=A0AAV8U9L1_9ROSI|nr:hypothetical protein K2173_017091 [Erythroxylum novogranatense]
MLCSGKSGSTWLDHLRSSKGFPAADNVDLEHFLLSKDDNGDSVTNASESSQSDGKQRRQATKEICSESRDKQWFNVMTNALSGLFNMGDPYQNPTRKAPRKQANPKFCVVSREIQGNCGGRERKDESVPAATTSSLNSDSNSNVRTKEEKRVVGSVDCRDDLDVEVEEEEGGGGEEEQQEREKSSNGVDGGDKELKGYSRSEVTVIDTSCVVWKFDKLVFRKKHTWKIRDKKSRSWFGGTKKRKKLDMGPGDVNGNVGPKKKAKVLNPNFSSSQSFSGGDLAPSNDVLIPFHENTQVCKETSDDIGPFLKKRSPRKFKSNPSMDLIKAIAGSKKCVRTVPKSHSKERLEKSVVPKL